MYVLKASFKVAFYISCSYA